MPAPLLIADVPWLLYRSFHGLPKSIKGADGEPVNALLGTVNALLAAVEAKAARAVVACFGAEDAAYRKRLYPPYHAHREPMPGELAHQWERAPALLASLGWSIADAGQLEADDAIGAHARAESSAGGRALLLTADRDLYQAVDGRVAVLDMSKRGVFELGPEQVRERYGVEPALVPDFIALRGDPSDGLPGAPGIGAKTAAALLREHGTLEDLLALAARQCEEAGFGELRRRTAETLHEHDELLRTFKRVATLVEIEVERPKDAPTDFAAGADAARELGMRRLAERLEAMA
ncbi:MAG TPA: 5'-3' exonuclease H3TH domain-containing protein [Solirubrobacteraceae bacterium]|jgi:DNA polymerase-1|nr:5'-3' exonuclease H3TH domain-containing protein [Solirubrobacteraceae bacterium]